MSFAIDVNIPDVQDRLTRMARKQVPFATALALTWTAKDAQKAVIDELPKRFTIRSPWIERGIRIRKATKHKPEATVFSRDPFMRLQEEGGTKRPSGKTFAIPAQIRKSKAQRITKAKRPARVLKQKSTYIAPLKGKNAGIFRKVGKKGRPKLLYVLRSGPQRVEPRLGMRETVERTVQKRWQKNFGKALARAIATQR